ncbi:hypothetical protein D0T49_04380 [Paludibacter sp. 221]|uniref:hypothetical protein n=1 Tax=Paludibacter sp. 221 TaxID=2302939 RepID=UPI0013D8CE0B|nr:hypothetical protein [Paludibacter sp. 221]NDV46275.1 hypothetical protein [Paludibacter sp. 221]
MKTFEINKQKYLAVEVPDEIVGITPLSEEQWAGIVESITVDNRVFYKDYLTNEALDYLPTATQSGESLLNSLGITGKYVIIKVN